MPLRLIPACWLLICCFAASAETPEDVYQVEVIVFERAHGAPTNDDETWPKNLEMAYPKHWVRLMSNTEAEQLEQENSEAETEDFSLPQDFLQSLGNSNSAQPTQDRPQTQQSLDPEQPAAASAGIESDSITANHPTYFRFLAENHKTLLDSKRGLDRLGNLRILFHETWLQPMKSADQAEALLIRAGNEFGEHRELEGYIVLSLSRYLHIQTNLWFSEFVPNYGQSSPHWPTQPAFPKQAHSADSALEPNAINLNESDPTGLARFSILTTELEPLGEEENSYSDLLQEAYITNEITVLQQKRRMRSREVHYIDHPRIGLLIKFIPYEPITTDEKS